jgi:hypothetical protein
MNDELDPFLRSSQIAKARGVSTRWLYQLVKVGQFPPPDRRATKRGEPNLWRASTARRALASLTDHSGP